MIERTIGNAILTDSKQYPVIAVTGPRQSGKTTLVRALFPDKKYINLEDTDSFLHADQDLRSFLTQSSDGLIIDEAQRLPKLFSMIQVLVDDNKTPGQYILTGSHNMQLIEAISQSLAGRISIFTLLPFAAEELERAGLLPNNVEQLLFQGLYPKIYDQIINPYRYYINYIQTYVERDVRQIKNIDNLALFQKFVYLCAGRVGQLLNLSSLADDCGINHNTARSWLSILEASYLVYLLKPHHNNYNKRVVKSPKLLFYDTGLVCSLLHIEDQQDLTNHYLKGPLFENWALMEFIKHRLNHGRLPNVFFWRDKMGKEVDCLIEHSGGVNAVEFKSGATLASDYAKGLNYYQHLSGNRVTRSFLVYGGDSDQQWQNISVRNWRSLALAVNQFFDNSRKES